MSGEHERVNPRRVSWRRKTDGVTQAQYVNLASEVSVLTERLRVLEQLVNSLLAARWGEPPQVPANAVFPPKGEPVTQTPGGWLAEHADQIFEASLLASMSEPGVFELDQEGERDDKD